MSDGFDRTEFMAGYLVEAEEHLAVANARLLSVESALQRGHVNPRAVRDLFRALHTIKGLSAMVGVEPVVDLAHEMENVLRALDRGMATMSANTVDLLLRGVRAIETRVGALAKQQPISAAPPELVLELAALLLRQPGRAAPPAPPGQLPPEVWDGLGASEQAQVRQGGVDGKSVWLVDFTPSVARAARGLSITSVRERIGQVGEIVKVTPHHAPADGTNPAGLVFSMLVLSSGSIAELSDAAWAGAVTVRVLAPGGPTGLENATLDVSPEELPEALPDARAVDPVEGPTTNRGSVRVDVARLDDALEKLAALVVTRSRLLREVTALRALGTDVRELLRIAQDVGRQVRDLRGAIMRARMVSMTELLERVPLLVRGLSHKSNKRVELALDAGNAELDKAVADQVFPALVHLVRNAIDHALEVESERQNLGKPAAGTLTVRCSARGDNYLELRVQDDGRGIDVNKLAARAGRDVPTTPAGLMDLLTLPGLSSLDTATHTSGRGMGMDIVKRIIVDDLGGTLRVDTERGVGTTFVLHVPLSMTIVEAFSFQSGNQTFAVPLAMVDEIIDIDPAHVCTPPAPHGSGPPTRLIERRGRSVPLFDLAGIFKLESVLGMRKAIIVQRNGEPLAVGIERTLGQQEIIIRPLNDRLVKAPGITGTTDLGNGIPTLVLDLAAVAAAHKAPVEAHG